MLKAAEKLFCKELAWPERTQRTCTCPEGLNQPPYALTSSAQIPSLCRAAKNTACTAPLQPREPAMGGSQGAVRRQPLTNPTGD